MHRATRLHFDFRLEHLGVLLSWAIPRGPTLDPKLKRLAVQTEDHPVDYGDFEGVIPSGYGAGTVLLWDIGEFDWTRESADDVEKSLRTGDVKFILSGQKLSGEFALVHIGERGRRYGGSGDETKNWLMIKKRDSSAVDGYEALQHEVSVATGRTLAQIAADGGGDPRERRRAERGAGGSGPRTRAAPQPLPLPTAPPPMLATPVDKPFSRAGWFYELKYDGVRAMVAMAGDALRIVGRSGRDETSRYPELRRLPRDVNARAAVIDGEVVVLDERGLTSFERLQSRINVSRAADVERAAAAQPAVFIAFDIVHLDGRDLAQTSLRIRKKTLHDVLRPSALLMYAEHVEDEGETFFAEVSRSGAEGMVAKRADSVYEPGRRSRDWLKVKAWLTQSCVVIGFTAGQGRRKEHLGALILAVMGPQGLVHCGQVGTGFNDATLRALLHELRAREEPSSAVDPAPRTAEPATWVRPELVCEVRHAGWTSAGILRHPAYLGLRPELTPRDCVRERAVPTASVVSAKAAGAGGGAGGPEQEVGKAARRVLPPSGPPRAAPRESPRGLRPSGVTRRAAHSGTRSGSTEHAAGDAHDEGVDGVDEALRQLKRLRANDRWEIAGRRVALTNLDKVFWPRDGYTKRDMVDYYVRMAPYLLPYLRDRPLSMQVFPDGIEGKSFWRKDKPTHAPEWIESWTYHGEKTKTYIVVNEVATLAWVANAGVVDLHPWHSRIDAPTQPDWAVFDLDPFEPATFHDVINIAKLVKAALDHYGMHGVVKTSGQTGLQIYVPLRRGPDYDAVRHWVEEVGTLDRQGVAGPGDLGVGGGPARRQDPHRLHAEHHQQDAGRALFAASGPRRSGLHAHRLGRARRPPSAPRPLDHADHRAPCGADRRPLQGRARR